MTKVQPRLCQICGLHVTAPCITMDRGPTHYHTDCCRQAEAWVALKSRVLGISADEYLRGRQQLVHNETNETASAVGKHR